MNLKSITIAVDESRVIQVAGNAAPETISLYRGAEWLITITLTKSTSDVAPYTLADGWDYAAYIGRLYGNDAAPILSITNQSKWNTVGDPNNGILSVIIDATDAGLATDMAGAISREYIMEIIATNGAIQQVLCQSPINIINTGARS